MSEEHPTGMAAARERAWRTLLINHLFDAIRQYVPDRDLPPWQVTRGIAKAAHGMAFAAGWEARGTEVEGLQTNLAILRTDRDDRFEQAREMQARAEAAEGRVAELDHQCSMQQVVVEEERRVLQMIARERSTLEADLARAIAGWDAAIAANRELVAEVERLKALREAVMEFWNNAVEDRGTVIADKDLAERLVSALEALATDPARGEKS